MTMVCREHDEDPEMRPERISPEKREDVIVRMAAGLLGAYRYFRSHRQLKSGVHRSEPRGNAIKVGRNDPCPVGRGRNTRNVAAGRRWTERTVAVATVWSLLNAG